MPRIDRTLTEKAPVNSQRNNSFLGIRRSIWLIFALAGSAMLAVTLVAWLSVQSKKTAYHSERASSATAESVPTETPRQFHARDAGITDVGAKKLKALIEEAKEAAETAQVDANAAIPTAEKAVQETPHPKTLGEAFDRLMDAPLAAHAYEADTLEMQLDSACEDNSRNNSAIYLHGELLGYSSTHLSHLQYELLYAVKDFTGNIIGFRQRDPYMSEAVYFMSRGGKHSELSQFTGQNDNGRISPTNSYLGNIGRFDEDHGVFINADDSGLAGLDQSKLYLPLQMAPFCEENNGREEVYSTMLQFDSFEEFAAFRRALACQKGSLDCRDW